MVKKDLHWYCFNTTLLGRPFSDNKLGIFICSLKHSRYKNAEIRLEPPDTPTKLVFPFWEHER